MAGPLDMIDLDKVKRIESQGSSQETLRTPNASGAVGAYQLTPPAWKDLQRVYPDKYGSKTLMDTAADEGLGRQASNDYFKVIKGYLKNYGMPETVENMLSAYSTGIGNVRKGIIPQETRDYLDKYSGKLPGF